MLIAAIVLAKRAFSWHRTRHNPRALPAALPDLLFAVFLLAVGAAALVTAARFPFEAGIFPMISAAALTVLVTAIAVQGFVRWRGKRPDVPTVGLEPEGEWSPTGAAALPANVRLLAMCAVLALLLVLLGHLAGGFLFIAGCLLATRAAAFGKALACAGGVTLFVYAVFDLVVSRPWPLPLLQRLAGL